LKYNFKALLDPDAAFFASSGIRVQLHNWEADIVISTGRSDCTKDAAVGIQTVNFCCKTDPYFCETLLDLMRMLRCRSMHPPQTSHRFTIFL